jgi:hypothetical protein
VADSNNKPSALVTQARDVFTIHAAQALPDIAKAILGKLVVLMNQPASAQVSRERRDAWLAFQAAGKAWTNGTNKAWRAATKQASQSMTATSDLGSGEFQLMDNDVMENKILASRLALHLLDVATWELRDLRLRVQSLEQICELQAGDIFRPDVLSSLMVEEWTDAGLSRDTWLAVQDLIQARLAEHLLEAYHKANEFLVERGVMPDIDLRSMVKRTPSSIVKAPSATPAAASLPLDDDQNQSSFAGNSGDAVGSSTRSAGGVDSAREEKLTQTTTSPLVRARMRAQGVVGNLQRLLSSQVAGFNDTRGAQPTPQLAQALAVLSASQAAELGAALVDEPGRVYGPEHVAQADAALRQRTSSLKKAASTSTEKATIEIVALMFQSILAEERIPPTVRVWFARLQMPVLRVAISEPGFFGSLQHPARQLIDRMGSCVLSFDAGVSGGAMEVEVKRIVQVIEQYPETGRRAFELVHDEFKKFLSKFLSENGSAARVVSIAQQVEQKETIAIQYTIEMRSMLNDMPVREEIREFLFKIWAEVLALTAMRNGPQHQETMTLKSAAADLVWAASAKPNRAERAKVISELPKLLQVLRRGMTVLAVDIQSQDQQLKVISDTLADAFMSKTDAISSERIDAMAKRLTNLEDYLSDEDVGDLPLDTEALVMMIGIDASDIEVVTDGGSQPTEAMRAWAQELQLGSWFSLDHNGRVGHVQFAWRSDRKQLHLFASADGRHVLIQARRLAAYLQAGLLKPTEEEALTVRATRDALAKLEANPERLLG